MQDRPSAQELIAAVASFLERELLPAVSDQRLRFRGLVAAHVLGVVARELAAGDAPLREEWWRLTALLAVPVDDPPAGEALRDAVRELSAELCARIRAGAFDDPPDFERALDHARDSTLEKIRIANPAYLKRLGI